MPAHIRPLDPNDDDEIALVADRMRQTLVEVLGDARGGAMYTQDWLVQRVRWHLEPDRRPAAVFVAEAPSGRIDGHTIVRTERDEDGAPFGLFSTTYVAPDARRAGVADALLDRGEAWMIAQGLARSATATDANNDKLIALFRKRGYEIRLRQGDMIQLSRALP